MFQSSFLKFFPEKHGFLTKNPGFQLKNPVFQTEHLIFVASYLSPEFACMYIDHCTNLNSLNNQLKPVSI